MSPDHLIICTMPKEARVTLTAKSDKTRTTFYTHTFSSKRTEERNLPKNDATSSRSIMRSIRSSSNFKTAELILDISDHESWDMPSIRSTCCRKIQRSLKKPMTSQTRKHSTL